MNNPFVDDFHDIEVFVCDKWINSQYIFPKKGGVKGRSEFLWNLSILGGTGVPLELVHYERWE